MGNITFENVQELLDSGKKPQEVFDWVDKIQDGFACVQLNGKWNFIDKNGKLLSLNQWFDYVSVFNDGFAWVQLNGKWNIIDKKGKQLLTNQLFDNAYAFQDGFAVVGLNGKWNYINKNCKLVSPNQWFNYCGDFHDGFAKVLLNEKWNYINKNGKILSPNQWFEDCDRYFYKGFARVKLNGKWKYIDKNGNLYDENKKALNKNINMEKVTFENVQELLDSGKKPEELFDECWSFHEGFAVVRLNGNWNFIDKNGKILSPNQWFDAAYYFHEGFACVRLNEKYNFIDENGNLYDENKKPLNKNNNMEKVTFENVQELLNEGKKPEELFDFVDDFSEGFALVRLHNKWNFIDRNGNLLTPNQWFDKSGYFHEGFAAVQLKGKSNYIDRNGNLYDENEKPLNESIDNCTCVEIPKELYDKLNYLGLIPNEIRKNNVGKSDYSRHTIQPWAIWADYDLNPWDADIIKRTLREKPEEGMPLRESRIMDYKKIGHIVKERIRQLELIDDETYEKTIKKTT